jgi:nicotinic acid mononucleotide adenylyltransferase
MGIRIFREHPECLIMEINLNGGLIKKSIFTFPGSFAPLHQGHINIARYVYNKYLSPIDFEISIRNVDKPDLTEEDMDKRIEDFKSKKEPCFGSLWITNAPRFLNKAKMFPGTTFVVGYDTFKRICDLKYYENGVHFNETLEMFDKLKIEWMIFPRPNQTFSLYDYPEAITKHADVESEFVPLNISSTMIREGNS